MTSLGAMASVGLPAQSSSYSKFDFGNSSFDISALTLRGSFYPVSDSQNNLGSRNYTYFINFGANIATNMLPGAAATTCNTTYWGGPTPLGANWQPSPAFQYANPSINAGQYDTCHRLGGPVGPSTMTWSLYDNTNPSRGVAVMYTGGDVCPQSNPRASRSLKLWLLCYDDATNIPDEEVILETSDCAYEIFIKSAFGCPIQCPLPAGGSGTRQLCSGHGVCDFDASQGNSRCFCNPGYTGDDCSAPASASSGGLSAAGGVLIGVSIVLALTLGFLGYLWFFKIARLRLDPSAYSALRAGPEGTAVQ